MERQCFCLFFVLFQLFITLIQENIFFSLVVEFVLEKYEGISAVCLS